MTPKKIAAALAATGLLASPVLAQTAETLRAPSPVQDSEELEGEGTGIILALLAAAAVIAGIIIATGDSGTDDLPTSP